MNSISKVGLSKVEVLDKIAFTLRILMSETELLSKEDKKLGIEIIGKLYDNILMDYPI